MFRLCVSLAIAMMFCLNTPGSCLAQSGLPYDYPPVLTNINEEIAKIFRSLDMDLSIAADHLSKTGLKGNEARTALGKLCAGRSYAIDCAAVDTNGIMVSIEPQAYRKFEGANISKQEQVIQLNKTKRAVFSQVFMSEEGINAVDIECPIFSSGRNFLGSVSILIKPEELLRLVIEPSVRGIPTEIWAMQKDGRIIYDAKKEEIGLILFSDPLYKPFPELIELGKSISNQTQGHGFYSFISAKTKQMVRKEVFWTSVGLYGTEWRIIATRYVPKN
ncbi:MAG: cache domain-containing protein [Syntrophorhabdaceae bacterium]